MSTDEVGSVRSLPKDPSPEELARYWTLSESDKAEVFRGRGDWNRRWFAVQFTPTYAAGLTPVRPEARSCR